MPSLIERILLLPSALLALTLSQALAAAVEARDAQSTTLPAPIAFNPDQNWDGNDGQWSTFTVQIGTPPQTIRTYLSWASYQTWGVLPTGCDGATDQHTCAVDRGWSFDNSSSSTWDYIGLYDLGIETNLGYEGNAFYGYDVVTLGAPGDGGPTLKNTTVGAFALDDFYLGVWGVNPKPTNFTSFNVQSPSYMTQLREQNLIPSVSFGYTAGAKYQGSAGVLASLTLGGYDSSKFIENDVEFTFAPDNSRDIVAAIQSISTPSQVDSSPTGTELLPSTIYAYLDATVPQIWLPVEACQAFENEFGLVYDDTTELYLVNNSLHQDLVNRNPSVTFKLGTSTSGGDTVSIQLPYAAFDLTASAGYQGLAEDTQYFPLRRAMNDTQYTLGRTFFQEAYIRINYDTQKFNVSQVSWDESAPINLVALLPYTINSDGSVSYSADSNNGSLSGGAIAGISVGACAVLAIIGIGLFVCIRRRKRAAQKEEEQKTVEREKLGSSGGGSGNDSNSTANTAVAPSVAPHEETGYIKAELAGSMPVQYESDDARLLSSGGLGSSNGSGSNTPRSPHAFSGYSNTNSPTTPLGEGTHSSTSSGERGTGTMMSGVSPTAYTPVEADSKQRQIFEMAGDMPARMEKDGREKTEKEAIAYREHVYNGVDSPPVSAYPTDDSNASRERESPRRVNPEDVTVTDQQIGLAVPLDRSSGTRHRAFSFEGARPDSDTYGSNYSQNSASGGSQDLYSPT